MSSQGGAPGMIGIRLDECTWDEARRSVCGHFYLTEEFHPWMVGPHAPQTPPRMHGLTVTGMPLTGIGPEWQATCGTRDVSDQGHDIYHWLCKTGPHAHCNARSEAGSEFLADILLDSDSEDRMNYEADGAAAAGSDGTLDGSGDYAYEYPPLSARARRALRGVPEPDDDALMARDLDEQHPSRVPCWRHDEFPFFNVTQVFDAAAGVRITGRGDVLTPFHCVSAASVPSGLRVESRVEAVYTAAGSRDGDEDRPACFDPSIWHSIMGRRAIFGDERWVVGESCEGALTVLLF